MNKTLKAYIISSLLSFLTGFAIVFLGDIDSLSWGSLKDGSLAGIVIVGIRAGIKYLLEDFIVKQAK